MILVQATEIVLIAATHGESYPIDFALRSVTRAPEPPPPRAYHNKLNAPFDHDWLTPGLFVTGDRDVGPITLSASVRADHHSAIGTKLTERLAILAHPAD